MPTVTVTVTCVLDSESDAGFRVEGVNPPTVDLFIGDSVIWQVSGIPEGHFLQFDMHELFGSVSPNPVEGNGSDVEVQGSDFQPTDRMADVLFSYSLTPLDTLKRPGTRFDPMIDSLGPPSPDDEGGS